MYRRNLYAVGVNGDYSRWIFVIAARDKAAAIQMVKDFYEEERNHYLPDCLSVDGISEQDLTCIAVDAAVENEGVIFNDGYTE